MKAQRKARAVTAALAVLALTTPARAAAFIRTDTPAAYRLAPDAQAVSGSESTADAPLLQPGTHTYRDTIEPGRRKYYTVRLEAGASAYVSAVAIPRPGSSMGTRDGIDVSLEAPNGAQCGLVRHRTFLSLGGAYPVADYAERAADASGVCAAAGTYRFSVERGDAAGGDPAAVPLELKYVTGDRDSGLASDPADTPAATGGGPGPLRAGSGFNDAVAIRPGTLDDEIGPGETHFYRVPVAAGERLEASARFGEVPDAAGSSYVLTGLRMGLNNAARGYVTNKTAGYRGAPATLTLTTPPAADGADTAGGDAARGMRLAGWYYLQVSLNPKVGQGRPEGARIPLSLTVDVGKTLKPIPQPPESRPHTAPASQRTAAGHRDGRLRLVGYAGVTTGSLLLLSLGAWTFAARRTRR
ncbi:hypothetical protein [Streptomyces sp. UNOC14_S4]|uniref:hypothetical protein n=1 Tax=Streptomyces sp. UNOC14_S4 TaxID=2872340 RepID=UPI001E53D0B7|nr:hypothetical protein [Streptomyces sp. UNOC14_S4]MCC3770106.1 hypothetical protein [Streptomyces sp. UNOC14_S4]